MRYRHSETGAVIGVSQGTLLAALVTRDDNWLDCTAECEWLAAEKAWQSDVVAWLEAESEGVDNDPGDDSGCSGSATGAAATRPGRTTAGRNRSAAGSKRPRGGLSVAVDTDGTGTGGDQPSGSDDGCGGIDSAEGDSAGNGESDG